MALSKYWMSQLIELTTETNAQRTYGPDDVRGMTITKQIIPTKADVSAADLSKYLVIHPGEFVFNPRTHGKHIGFGYNDTTDSFIISWNNMGFRVRKEMHETVLPEYLFLHFNRNEWDREACYRSWGSSTEVFSWDALCEMQLDLPSLPVQQKYVDIYKAMVTNQQSYERGLEDLKLAVDATIEKYKHGIKRRALEEVIIESDLRNYDLKIKAVHGVNKDKQFMPSVANGEDISKYKLVEKGYFACNLMHVGRDVVVPVALNTDTNPKLVSPAYIVFGIDQDIFIPEFVLMWLSREETDRFAWFMCDSSVRSGMEKKRFFEITIPQPPLQEQQALVNIHNALINRGRINEQLKRQVRDICPILIKGSLEAGNRWM